MIDIFSLGRRSSTAWSAPTWRSLRRLRSSVSGPTAEPTRSTASDSPRRISCTRCGRQGNNVCFNGLFTDDALSLVDLKHALCKCMDVNTWDEIKKQHNAVLRRHVCKYLHHPFYNTALCGFFCCSLPSVLRRWGKLHAWPERNHRTRWSWALPLSVSQLLRCDISSLVCNMCISRWKKEK